MIQGRYPNSNGTLGLLMGSYLEVLYRSACSITANPTLLWRQHTRRKCELFADLQRIVFLFLPQYLTNLGTCGLWATVDAGLVLSSSISDITLSDAVGLGVSSLLPSTMDHHTVVDILHIPMN